MNSMTFSGVYTAIVTPMKEDGAVDYDGLARLIEYQLSGGVKGIVAVGTTGESPTLSPKEHLEVIRQTVKTVNGRALTIAGTGSNNTEESLQYTREADEVGADAILQVTPYYNKPSQEGLFRHFSAVAKSTERPVILYSIPGRCGIEISVETCARLYEAHPAICAIKESGGQCDKVAALRNTLGDDYSILSGDDNMTLPFMACGANGVVSVASNLYPRPLVEMVEAALEERDFRKALKIHLRFQRLFRDLFIEPNPVPVKYTLKEAGLVESDHVRLPLCPMSIANKEQVKQTLTELSLVAE